MAIDIREIVEEIVGKIKKDPDILKNFKKDPIKVVESLLGIDLPDEQIEKIADLVKAKIDIDKVGDLLGGLFGKK